eukprot:GHVS01080455.1.p1 GENE.GHVS01080455.1~~GHVS01080455.1.p1  ORF type:complete len:279 (-),score=79.09 GHVS01080455.1:1-837(-)
MSTTPFQSSTSSSSTTSSSFVGGSFPFHSAPPNFDFFSSSSLPSTTSPPPPSAGTTFRQGATNGLAQMNNFFSSFISGGTNRQNSSTSTSSSFAATSTRSSPPPPPPSSVPPTTTTTAPSPPPATSVTRPAFCLKRLQKERKELLSRPPDNISMNQPTELFEWLVNIKGADGTEDANEEFVLRFRFPERYPLDSPEVTFVDTPPIHPHVYSNGHICLSILYDGWSPALSVSSICLSLISMLSSCKRKEKPQDDGPYVRMAGSHVSPKHMRWIFHDDTV